MKARVSPITASPRFSFSKTLLAGREHDERRAEPQVEAFVNAEGAVLAFFVADQREHHVREPRVLRIQKSMGG